MALRIIGFTETVNECDCCGKKELKGTYVMADDNDNEMYYGRVCGAKHAGWSVSEFNKIFSNLKTAEKLQAALLAMANEANTQAKQDAVMKFVEKHNLDKRAFLDKYGEVTEKQTNPFYPKYTIFVYGRRTHIMAD